MPTMESRVELLTNLMKKQSNKLSKSDIQNIAKQTSNFSGSDLTQLAKDAAMAPLREMSITQIKGFVVTRPKRTRQQRNIFYSTNGLRPLVVGDITKSYQRVRPSTTKESIAELEMWTKSYGELSTKNI